MNILRIDASMRKAGSVSRQLSDELIDTLVDLHPGATVTTRDLADGVQLIDEDWINANFTPAEERDAAQRATLALSETLVAELKAADQIVIGVPIYNFGVPAALKAWVDMICRARATFRYGKNGPEGLLKGKTAYLVVASGGTDANARIDFATGFMKHILGFIGVTDVHVVNASAHMKGEAEALARARAAFPAAMAA